MSEHVGSSLSQFLEMTLLKVIRDAVGRFGEKEEWDVWFMV